MNSGKQTRKKVSLHHPVNSTAWEKEYRDSHCESPRVFERVGVYLLPVIVAVLAIILFTLFSAN